MLQFITKQSTSWWDRGNLSTFYTFQSFPLLFCYNIQITLVAYHLSYLGTKLSYFIIMIISRQARKPRFFYCLRLLFIAILLQFLLGKIGSLRLNLISCSIQMFISSKKNTAFSCLIWIGISYSAVFVFVICKIMEFLRCFNTWGLWIDL